MLSKTQIYNKVLSKLAQQRDAAELLANEKLKSSLVFPDVRDAFETLKRNEFQLAKSKALGVPCSLDLNKSQNELFLALESHGFSKDEFLPRRACHVCEDSGFVDGKLCDCVKKQILSISQKESHLPENANTFEDFKDSIFEGNPNKEGIIRLKNKLKRWCDNYPNVGKRNLVLTGGVGVGKTFLATAIASSFVKRGILTNFVSSFQLSQIFLQYHISKIEDKASVMHDLLSAELLVIDDLGVEPIYNNVTACYMQMVIDERNRANLATVITTNLAMDELAYRYGERAYSRLTDKSKTFVVEIGGDDLRKKN